MGVVLEIVLVDGSSVGDCPGRWGVVLEIVLVDGGNVRNSPGRWE